MIALMFNLLHILSTSVNDDLSLFFTTSLKRCFREWHTTASTSPLLTRLSDLPPTNELFSHAMKDVVLRPEDVSGVGDGVERLVRTVEDADDGGPPGIVFSSELEPTAVVPRVRGGAKFSDNFNRNYIYVSPAKRRDEDAYKLILFRLPANLPQVWVEFKHQNLPLVVRNLRHRRSLLQQQQYNNIRETGGWRSSLDFRCAFQTIHKLELGLQLMLIPQRVEFGGIAAATRSWLR